jgi:cell division protein FtsN
MELILGMIIAVILSFIFNVIVSFIKLKKEIEVKSKDPQFIKNAEDWLFNKGESNFEYAYPYEKGLRIYKDKNGNIIIKSYTKLNDTAIKI